MDFELDDGDLHLDICGGYKKPHLWDTIHSSRSFLEKCFVSLATFKAMMLKEWISTWIKMSLGIVDTHSYLTSTQIRVPDEEEALELQ